MAYPDFSCVFLILLWLFRALPCYLACCAKRPKRAPAAVSKVDVFSVALCTLRTWMGRFHVFVIFTAFIAFFAYKGSYRLLGALLNSATSRSKYLHRFLFYATIKYIVCVVFLILYLLTACDTHYYTLFIYKLVQDKLIRWLSWITILFMMKTWVQGIVINEIRVSSK